MSRLFWATALVGALVAGLDTPAYPAPGDPEASTAPAPGAPDLTSVNWQGLAAEGVKALPKIQTYMEQVDWPEYAEHAEAVPGSQDMVLTLVAILRQDAQGVPAFGDMLRTGSWKVRWGALTAIQLTPIRDARFLPGLDLTLRDANREVRFRGALVLSEIPDPKMIPIARRVVQAERDHMIRIKAAEGLGRQRQTDGANLLLGYLKHADIWVREAAGLALGSVRTPGVHDGLVAALKTEKTNIVQGAILDSLRSHTGRDWFDLRDQHLGPGWRPDRPSPAAKKGRTKPGKVPPGTPRPGDAKPR